MGIYPTGRTPRTNINHNNYNKVVLHFTDAALSGDSISYWTWTFNILISNTYGSKNKYDIGNISVKLPTNSERAALIAVSRNRIIILDTLLNLVINNKNEMEEPSTISARLGGDNHPKEREFTIKITNTISLKSKLKERGLITEEA